VVLLTIIPKTKGKTMRLSTKAMAIAGAVIWGGCGMFLTGLLNQLIPPFGGQFLQTMSSVYPGYHVTSGLAGVLIGTLYGIVDGAVGGFLFAWVYNRFAG
jgi:hypothetical protein